MIDLARLNVRDFFGGAIAETPGSSFLVFTGDDREWSYRDAGAEITRAAAAWHSLGVGKGDRVAFMLDNSPQFVWAWLGLASIGGVLVAINTGFKTSEAEYLVRDSGARFVLAGDEHVEVLRGVQAALPEVAVLHGDAGTESFTALMEAELDPAPHVELSGDDVISLIYTSGTTGNPKGVMQTHRNFVLTGQAYVDWMHMERGDRIYACLPLFHINSQAYSTMAAIAARGAMVLSPRFSASRFWSEVRRHRVTVFNFIGAMALILTKSEPSADDADNAVRIAYGVPTLATEVVDAIEHRFGLRCISGFGMSETTFGLLEPLDQPRRPGSMGIERHHPDPMVPRTQAKIVDGDGVEVPRGTAGELLLKNAAMMLGYFGRPAKTAETLIDGWLHTGDSAYQDEDGFFFFVDRMKDIVRRRGENISSLEVERTVARHPHIAEAAVIGVPAELSDEELLVFVVPRDPGEPVTADEVFVWAAEHLADFKVPLYVRLIGELPKTATAKVQKEKLRAIDADDRSGRIERAGARR
ncbi:AMP-binding protein [Gryllotalpicola reticulitermitis]|uniref:AMP-binding protein n=1 Tax=Gryllotalpicola reticulitermitis TaxID=1184153 RepID=A0ABV8Q1E7_9MICO